MFLPKGSQSILGKGFALQNLSLKTSYEQIFFTKESSDIFEISDKNIF